MNSEKLKIIGKKYIKQEAKSPENKMKKEVSENSVKSYCKFLSRKHEILVLNLWIKFKYNAFVNLYP
jgi:hypothetical protein